MKKVDKEIRSMFRCQIERAIESWLRYDLPFGKDITNVELLDGNLSVYGYNITGRKIRMIDASIKRMQSLNCNMVKLGDT